MNMSFLQTSQDNYSIVFNDDSGDGFKLVLLKKRNRNPLKNESKLTRESETSKSSSKNNQNDIQSKKNSRLSKDIKINDTNQNNTESDSRRSSYSGDLIKSISNSDRKIETQIVTNQTRSRKRRSRRRKREPLLSSTQEQKDGTLLERKQNFDAVSKYNEEFKTKETELNPSNSEKLNINEKNGATEVINMFDSSVSPSDSKKPIPLSYSQILQGNSEISALKKPKILNKESDFVENTAQFGTKDSVLINQVPITNDSTKINIPLNDVQSTVEKNLDSQDKNQKFSSHQKPSKDSECIKGLGENIKRKKKSKITHKNTISSAMSNKTSDTETKSAKCLAQKQYQDDLSKLLTLEQTITDSGENSDLKNMDKIGINHDIINQIKLNQISNDGSEKKENNNIIDMSELKFPILISTLPIQFPDLKDLNNSDVHPIIALSENSNIELPDINTQKETKNGLGNENYQNEFRKNIFSNLNLSNVWDIDKINKKVENIYKIRPHAYIPKKYYDMKQTCITEISKCDNENSDCLICIAFEQSKKDYIDYNNSSGNLNKRKEHAYYPFYGYFLHFLGWKFGYEDNGKTIYPNDSEDSITTTINFLKNLAYSINENMQKYSHLLDCDEEKQFYKKHLEPFFQYFLHESFEEIKRVWDLHKNKLFL